MKHSRKLLAIVLTLALCIISLSVPVTASAAAAPKLNKSAYSVVIGGADTVKVSNAKGAKITYKSNKTSIVKISTKGKITGVKAGKAKITVTVKKGNTTKKLTADATVKKPGMSTSTNMSLKVGSTATLTLKNKPAKAASPKYKWTTSNSNIVSVSSKGAIKAKKVGTATIKVKVYSGKKYSYTLSTKVTVVKNYTLSNFKSSETDFGQGVKENVTFTVKSNAVNNNINVVDSNGKTIGKMHDDGKNGDAKKDDNIYSYKYTTTSKDSGIIKYTAKTGSIKSGAVTTYVYETPNENKINALLGKLENDLGQIASKYVDSEGSIPEAKFNAVINEVFQYANKLVADGDLYLCEKSADGVYVKFCFGPALVFTPAQFGVDAAGDDVSVDVVTCQPCYSQYDSDMNDVMALPDDAASTVANTFSRYSYTESNNLDNEEVSLNQIKQFGANQVIIWHGHGGYNSRSHSFLVTGEQFKLKMIFDVNNWKDYIKNRTMLNSDGRLMITSKFIDKYCGDMDNSFVYLAACDSGRDDTLANAFLNKGAEAVVANTETIYTIYNCKMQNTVIKNMCFFNRTTRKYHSVGEALSYAKSVHGNNDLQWASDEHYATEDKAPAEPKIFGDENYRFSSVRNGIIDGTVCLASNHETPVSGATVNVYSGDTADLIGTATTDENGQYSFTIPAGTYKLEVKKNGYVDFSAFVDVVDGETTPVQTFLLVLGSEYIIGTASGKVTNAFTGSALPGVSLEFRKGWNNTTFGDVVKSGVTTNSNGEYSVTLGSGNYTAIASKEGYITSYFNIVVQMGTTGNQNGSLTPVLSGDQYRIVITWGENPRDLDSHVQGCYSDDSQFHVYYVDMSAYEGDVQVCQLDVDDTDSYGPETITLQTVSSKPYYYYIHRYAGEGSIATSGAQIKVYQGAAEIATYNPPTNQGTDDYWNVFAIVNGRIVTRNTITSSPDTNYAN